TGAIRAREEGPPLADVQVVINAAGIPFNQPLRTGKDGGLRFHAMPGRLYWNGLSGRDVPPLSPLDFVDFPKTVPANGSTWEMPAVEVATRTTVRGTVTDAAGRPVSGATVVGVWVEYGYRLRAGMARIVTVTSGSQGEFTIPGVDSSKQVWLKAI